MRATSLPARNARYLLDNTVFIAVVKRRWRKSAELIWYLLDGPAELFAGIKMDGLIEVWSNLEKLKYNRVLWLIYDRRKERNARSSTAG